MSLVDLYHAYHRGEITNSQVSKAQEIAFEILSDVTDRSGWENEWDGFDSDIKEEIIETWVEKIQAVL